MFIRVLFAAGMVIQELDLEIDSNKLTSNYINNKLTNIIDNNNHKCTRHNKYTTFKID